MPHPVVGQQDAARVGMPLEADAHQVVGLALVPVGRRPDVGHRVDDGLGARHVDVQFEVGVGGERVEMVDGLEAIAVVDGGHEVAGLIRQSFERAQARRNVVQSSAVDHSDDRVGFLHAGVAKAGAEGVGQARGDVVDRKAGRADRGQHR